MSNSILLIKKLFFFLKILVFYLNLKDLINTKLYIMKKKVLTLLSFIIFGIGSQVLSCPHSGTWNICSQEDIIMIYDLIERDCPDEDVVVYFDWLDPEFCPPI